MKLSILVCSVISRVPGFLSNLIKQLEPQLVDEVELLISVDNKKRTVGEKRNDLLQQSQGKYIVFIDDDDSVDSEYVANILKAAEENTDVITFGACRYVNGIFDKEVKYGIQYRKDYEDLQFYYRIPNHLMAFKRELAIQVPYPFISFGEDAEWARKIFYKIKTQKDIGKVLYHYYFSPQTTQTQNAGTQ